MRWLGIGIYALLGIALAVLAFVQTSTLVLNKRLTAAAPFAISSAAWFESAAVARLRSEAKDNLNLTAPAQMALPLAERAFAASPLVPKALAIMALAQEQPEDRTALLRAARMLNRREIMLQAAALQAYGEQRDFDSFISVFNDLMRVHPEQQQVFFTQLREALNDKNSIPAFVRMLDQEPEWGSSFMTFAARDPDIFNNFVQLRERLPNKNDRYKDADSLLLTNLIKRGELDEAAAIYRRVSGNRIAAGKGELGWTDNIPPFDWSLTHTPTMRAQPRDNGRALSLYIRDGDGGTIAERLIRLAPGDYRIAMRYDLPNLGRNKSIQFSGRCTKTDTPIFEQALSEGGETTFTITDDAACRFLKLEISGRAILGAGNIRGEIASIAITPR